MQLFVGRVAMLGFAAELIGEELTGTHCHHQTAALHVTACWTIDQC